MLSLYAVGSAITLSCA